MGRPVSGVAARAARDGRIKSRPLPEDAVFDCALGRMAREVSPTSEADPIGVLATLVTAVSAMLGRMAWVQIGDSRHPLLVWALLVGGTSSGRKGTATDAARRILEAADPGFMTDNTVSGLSSAEGLVAQVQDADEEDEGDEPAGSKKKEDKRLLVIENEYSIVMTRSRREGNALGPVMREAWDGRSLRVMTKVPLVATDPHIAILGHVTPGEFRAKASAQDLAGGSYNRFLMFYVERSQRLPHGGGADDLLIQDLGRELRNRVALARVVGPVSWSDESRGFWVSIYHELVDLEDDPDIAEWVARSIPYTLRVAALYAALDGRITMSAADLRAAIALIRYGLESARFVVGSGGKSGYLEKISAWVVEAGEEGLPKSVITKRLSGRMTAAEIDELLELLVAQPAYEARVLHTAGRPATRLHYVPR